ncbi:uncharacterized protein LOC144030746 [Festucalex cinctus]
MLWLKAEPIHDCPQVIADHFIKTVACFERCPQQLQADPRMMTKRMEKMLTLLNCNHTDSYGEEQSFIDACSTTSQHMESWLPNLRETSVKKWTNIFLTLKQDGHFTGSDLDKKLIQVCFLKLVQDKLNELLEKWNSQQTRGGEMDQHQSVPQKDIELCLMLPKPKEQHPHNKRVHARCRQIMTKENWNYPVDVVTAVALYPNLKSKMWNIYEPYKTV